MKPMSKRTKILGVATALSAAITILLALATGGSYIVDQMDDAAAQDAAVVVHGSKHGSLVVPQAPSFGAPAVERGEFTLTQTRLPSPGSVDVTAYPQFVRDALSYVTPVHGVIWSHTQKNALTHEGAKRMLDCALKATGCPAADAFYFALYKTSTETRATSTSADIAELTEAGYARINITAANWTCTKATPSNCVTASKVFTAGEAWSVTGLAVMDASSAGNVWAYSNFARSLANTDTLTVTYTLNLQSTAD